MNFGKAAWQMPGDFSQTRSEGTVEGIPKGSLVPGWRPALPDVVGALRRSRSRRVYELGTPSSRRDEPHQKFVHITKAGN